MGAEAVIPDADPARSAPEPVRHLVPTVNGVPLVEPPLDAPLPVAFTPYRRPSIVAPAPRWVGPLFVTLAVLLIPWTILLGFQLDANDRVTWVGFDLILLIALAATGYLSLRRSTWVEETAAVAATLLVVDAWFDVTTSHGWERMSAILAAALIELPLAALCIWIARHAGAVAERSTQFLHERSQRQAAKLREHTMASRRGRARVLVRRRQRSERAS